MPHQVLASAGWRETHPSASYVAPFALFLAFLALFQTFPFDPRWEGPVRCITLALVCIVCWPREIPIHPRYWLASVAIGAAVFCLWIGPDLFIPGYRGTLLFSNPVVGRLHSSLAPGSLQDPWVLTWRTIRAVIIVPIVEELFWRAWLMRWLINTDFQRIPLGSYAPLAFWATALLFASEHGPYWDVGLLTGIIYNLWMIRSKSVADCILMHAITNGILSAYVISTAQWQYWL